MQELLIEGIWVQTTLVGRYFGFLKIVDEEYKHVAIDEVNCTHKNLKQKEQDN